ncbi:NAD(P)/FAD-dependent oxidoreductase [candidate division WOR-3 bacterium]|nr:NAD(P)/FAD-dependent oxidoreductase [candidate division WOR-3 bacterium]
MKKHYKIIIIGSGPAGLFCAYKLVKKGYNDILIIDANKFPSGGLLNDCKLNLSTEIGMDLNELQLSKKKAEKYISQIDDIFIKFGAPIELFGTNPAMYQEWIDRAKRNDAELIPAKQRHIGTDMSKKIIKKIRFFLEENGCEFLLGEKIKKIISEKDITLISKTKRIQCEKLLIAPGRTGSKWLRDISKDIGIIYSNGKRIDVGIRVELKREHYPITDLLYDPKFIIKTKYNTPVRTFCTNPGGRIRIEQYDEFNLINGDALKKTKTENTNFALLNTIELTEPLTDPFLFGRLFASATNILGNGKPIIQRVGDFLDEKRSKLDTFYDRNRWFNKVNPTLEPGKFVSPGDIRMAYPYKIIKSLKEALIKLNKIFDNPILKEENLLYAPEIKFYSFKYKTNKFSETSIKNIFVAGDGAGKSRGIVGAAISGMLVAEGMMDDE